LEGLLNGLPLHAGAEVTIESNPEDVTPESLARWGAIGINRISVGIQSLREEELQALERRRSLEESLRAMETLSGSAMEWSVDLIAGMAGQTGETLRRTLDRAVGFRPPHVSLYALETKPESRVRPQDPDRVAGLLLGAWEHLRESGYRHYEISNFCLPGHECRHNLGYWKREDYIGCGASAHSLLGEVRSWNTGDVHAYMARAGGGGDAEEGRETLTADQQSWEEILLGMRLNEGIPEAGVVIESGEEMMEEQGWISRSGARVALTERGMLVFNEIVLRMAPAGRGK
jgi:oxygen-independent coproporphyrinogen-3 oxidase